MSYWQCSKAELILRESYIVKNNKIGMGAYSRVIPVRFEERYCQMGRGRFYGTSPSAAYETITFFNGVHIRKVVHRLGGRGIKVL